jgi:hypothetical protein
VLLFAAPKANRRFKRCFALSQTRQKTSQAL